MEINTFDPLHPSRRGCGICNNTGIDGNRFCTCPDGQHLRGIQNYFDLIKYLDDNFDQIAGTPPSYPRTSENSPQDPTGLKELGRMRSFDGGPLPGENAFGDPLASNF